MHTHESMMIVVKARVINTDRGSASEANWSVLDCTKLYRMGTRGRLEARGNEDAIVRSHKS
jgi:hypothetical protein